jgi:hypothetical protein
MSATLRPHAPAGQVRLNGALLFCNFALVLVNLLLALRVGDEAPARSDGEARRGPGLSVVMPCSRVLQTLASIAPAQNDPLLTEEALRAIVDAVSRYHEIIRFGIENLMYAPSGTDLGLAFSTLDRDARNEIEILLGVCFSDAAVVQRLTTEVIRSSR